MKLLKPIKEEKVDFHEIVANMADIPRHQAKTINLGLFYGMGKAKLQAQLGVSKEKAEELLGKYNTEVPFVKQLLKGVMSRGPRLWIYPYVAGSPLSISFMGAPSIRDSQSPEP